MITCCFSLWSIHKLLSVLLNVWQTIHLLLNTLPILDGDKSYSPSAPTSPNHLLHVTFFKYIKREHFTEHFTHLQMWGPSPYDWLMPFRKDCSPANQGQFPRRVLTAPHGMFRFLKHTLNTQWKWCILTVQVQWGGKPWAFFCRSLWDQTMNLGHVSHLW